MGPHPHFLIVFDVHRHALETALIDRPGFAPGLNGLGQEPLDTFFADPFAPARQ